MRRIYLLFNKFILIDISLVTQLVYIYIYIYMLLIEVEHSQVNVLSEKR